MTEDALIVSTLQIQGRSFKKKKLEGICMYGSIDGETEFSFDHVPNRFRHTVQIDHQPSKGWFTRCCFGADLGSVIVKGIPLSYVPIGNKRRHLCKHCLRITSKVKVFDECKLLSFCSEPSCIERGHNLMKSCGNLLQSILADASITSGEKDLYVLAVLSIHACYESNQSPGCNILSILKLELHEEADTSELRNSAEYVASKISLLSPKISDELQSIANMCKNDTLNVIWRVLKAVKFNSYSIPVPTLHDTQVMFLFPLLSLVNHSCSPNCIVQIPTICPPTSIVPMVSRTKYVCVHLKAIRDIIPGEELTISYLSNPCLPYEFRQEILKQSFYFTCTCFRCLAEQKPIVEDPEFQAPLDDSKSVKAAIEDRDTTAVSSDRAIILSAAGSLNKSLALQSSHAHNDGSSGCVLPGEWNDLNVADILRMIEKVLFTTPLAREPRREDYLLSYACHDIVMAVLADYGTNKTASTASTTTMSMNAKDGHKRRGFNSAQIVRAYLSVAECWRRVGCAYAPRRLELLLAGASMGCQLLAQGAGAGKASSAVAVARESQLVGLITEMLDSAERVIDVLGWGSLGPASASTAEAGTAGAGTAAADTVGSGAGRDRAGTPKASMFLPRGSLAPETETATHRLDPIHQMIMLTVSRLRAVLR